MSDAHPGLWLRLTALGAAAATGLAAASGELGIAHRALVLAALPPLVALVVAAWTAHRPLLVPAGSALGLFLGATVTWWSGSVHVALAALAFAAALVGRPARDLYRGAPRRRAGAGGAITSP